MCLLSAPLQAPYCNRSKAASTPDSTFTDNGDGTVTHQKTGLIWMRCSLGQRWNGSSCEGEVASCNWQQAIKQAQSSDFAGHQDWGLPNRFELVRLVETSCRGPAINAHQFPDTPASGDYWTSSFNLDNRSNAWYLSIYKGKASEDYRGGYLHVRLVRGSSWDLPEGFEAELPF